MKTKWTASITRKGTGGRALTRLKWLAKKEISPVVSFEMVKTEDQLLFAQAYPVGTGERPNEMVDWLLENAKGTFRFGVRDTAPTATLVVQFSYAPDLGALEAAFPDTDEEGDAA